MHRQRTTHPHTATDTATRGPASRIVTSTRDTHTAHTGPDDGPVDPVVIASVIGRDAPPALRDSINRHPTAVGERLDTYLAAVARELEDHGVLTGAPQRTHPGRRLIGSIVVDCTTLRIAAWTPTDQQPAAQQSLGAAVHPVRLTPVIATWDEHDGWCVGLHHGPNHASSRYLHPDLLPAARTVAEFVVDLALGNTSGADHPITPAPGPGRPRLHVVQ